MIASGSHEPGVDVAAWLLPEGTALRFERPIAELRPFFASYVVLDSDVDIFKGPNSWLLPGSAQLWFALTPEVRVKTRVRPSRELGAGVVIGPSSVTMPVQSQGGVSIVIEPTPLGWSRLFPISAASLRDRIVPLVDLLPPAWTTDLLPRLHGSDRGKDVKQILDMFLVDNLPPPNGNEERIERIEQFFMNDADLGDVAGWHTLVGLGSARTLGRMCERCFGFSPKILQRRRRFLRVLAAMLVTDGPVDFRIVPPGYHDVPHFLRDARHFLGMTAREFISMPMTYLRASLRARLAVVGSPLLLLDRSTAAYPDEA